MPPFITSLQNVRLKQALKLRDRRGRDQQGRIVIDGLREIARAVQAKVEIVELFYCEPLCDSPDARQLIQQAASAGAELLPVSEPVMEKLAFGQRGEGLVAVAKTPHQSLNSLKLASPANSVVAVLEGVEKPGNLGAVLRTADAAGIAAVIVADGSLDLYNPNAIRASLGAIFTVPVCAATSQEALAWLRDGKFRLLAARVDGASDYAAASYTGPTAIALGSEADGLTDLWRASDIAAIKLPMLGQVDSLNLSATAAILFYEALRQRQRR